MIVRLPYIMKMSDRLTARSNFFIMLVPIEKLPFVVKKCDLFITLPRIILSASMVIQKTSQTAIFLADRLKLT